jgi:protein disulfide-isomerase
MSSINTPPNTMNHLDNDKLTIEIWSDVACPFCYIGKTNFENALNSFAKKDDIEVVWRSFILDPTLPEVNNKNLYESLSEKKGLSMDQVMQMTEGVQAMATRAGLQMNFDEAQAVNTFKAHRVLQLAKKNGKGGALKEALLEAYFTQGANVADASTLKSIAGKVGLSPEEVVQALEQNEYAEAVNDDVAEARSLGINGVPYFVIDRKYGISGAQPPEAFSQALERAYQEWSNTNKSQLEEVKSGSSCEPSGNCD